MLKSGRNSTPCGIKKYQKNSFCLFPDDQGAAGARVSTDNRSCVRNFIPHLLDKILKILSVVIASVTYLALIFFRPRVIMKMHFKNTPSQYKDHLSRYSDS